MSLKKFYDTIGVPKEHRMKTEKNIILIVPEKDYDVSAVLARMGIGPYEVGITYPKNGVNMLAEVCATEPQVVVQVDKQFYRKFPVVGKDGDWDASFEERLKDAVTDRFVALHHHDEFSIKDGLGTVEQLIRILKAQRRSYCCVTNHGNIGGWIRQYNACRDAGIKPIFGMEAYMNRDRIKERSANHLILLANNEEGFYNIIKIHNDAQINGFYYDPRANWECIEKWGSGVIGTSACFLPGTLVFDKNGFSDIENVKSVITHSGRLKECVNTSRQYSGLMKDIICRGVTSKITSTDGHKFWVIKKCDQLKSASHFICKENNFSSINKQVRNARRREFTPTWTSNVEEGDWLLFPRERNESTCKSISMLPYKNGNRLGHRTVISPSGLAIIKEARRSCGLSLKELKNNGSWTKSNLYRVENGKGNPSTDRLNTHLNLIGISADEFMLAHCSSVTSLSCGLIRKNIPDELPISKELLFFLGIYCAEGHTTNHFVGLTLHINEVELSKEICYSVKKVFGLDCVESEIEENNRRTVRIGSLVLKLFIDDVCGSGAGSKVIPGFVFGLPFAMQKSFIRGYMLGDGHSSPPNHRSNGRILSASISEKLSLGLTRLLLNGGYYPTTYIKDAHGMHKKSYWISIAGKQQLGLSQYIWNGIGDGLLKDVDKVRNNIPISVGGIDYFTSTVISVNRYEVEDIKVCCLNVEEDHSFIVGFSSVHNCFAGEIPRFLMNEELDEQERFVRAKEVYDFYNGSLDQFYIELQIIEFEEQRELNRRLINFCHKVDGNFVLASDSHYLEPEQAETHDLLMMARQGKTVLDKIDEKSDVWNFTVRNLYYRNAEQMETTYRVGFDEQILVPDEDGIMEKETIRKPGFIDEVFTEEVFEQAMSNTHKIAQGCEDIKLDDSVKLPKLYDDSAEMLRIKVNEGFKERKLNRKENKKEYTDRLVHEFDIVSRLGWADYFLVTEYIVKWAYENFGEWAVGPGRGSAAGSLISYCLNITDIDPIEHGLLFERFLDESRPDPPDIDLDFDTRIRQPVKDHIIEKFGRDYTCSIGTYSTYKTKAVIVEMARVLGLDVHEAEFVTKKMESLQSFEDDDGEESIVDKMPFSELEKHYPELKEYFERYPEVKIHAKVLRNQVKNMGKHAGGVIISDLNLNGKIPIQLDKDGNIISSWAESGGSAELSKVGLVKYDVLGLANLQVVGDCIKLVEKHRGIKIKRKDVPISDRESILMGSKRDLVGIFQFENPATREIVDAVEMESLNDVSAITSLLRPGPKDMGMHEEYAHRKHGHPYEMPEFMKEALRETYGIIVYQEQCMLLSKVLAGFTGPEANKLRKAIGKKLEDLMAEMKAKFISGSKPRIDAGDITEEEVFDVWNQLEAFAGYGFNKSIDKDTEVATSDGIRRIEDIRTGQKVWCFDGSDFVETEVVALHDHGFLPAIEVIFDDDSKEICTVNHKFLTEHGQIPIRDIIKLDYGVYSRNSGGISIRRVIQFREAGTRRMYDLEVSHESHNFVLASGLITSNSHAVAYSAVTTAQLWLKYHYPVEYVTALANNTKQGKKKMNIGVSNLLVHYLNYGRKRGFDVLPPSVNKSSTEFTIEGNKIRFSMSHIKKVASNADFIEKMGPYESISDFYEKCVFQTPVKSGVNAGKMQTTRPNKGVVERLIAAGAFDELAKNGIEAFEKKNALLAEYYSVKKGKKEEPKVFSRKEWKEKEVEAIGLCLSEPPLSKKWEDLINKKGWMTIDEDDGQKKKVMMFGQIIACRAHTSKKGNAMHIVTFSDGIDSIDFFVFEGGRQYFFDNCKTGQIVAMPLSKFEDGNTRFFDEYREPIIVAS